MGKIKKSLSLALALSFIALNSFTSCNDGDSVELGAPLSESLKIHGDLQKYNDSLVLQPDSRGIGLVGWLSVAIADGGGAYGGAKGGATLGAFFGGPGGAVAGGIIGGVVVGAASSISQYVMADNISNFNPYWAPKSNPEPYIASYVLSQELVNHTDYRLGVFNGLDSCSINVAILHNKILELFGAENVEKNKGHLMTKLSNTEKKIVLTEDFSKLYKTIVEKPLDFDVNPNPTTDKIMNLFIDAVSNSCHNQDDMNRIISKYVSMVKQSNELSVDEKSWLYIGFAVTGYSFEYWTNKFSISEVL